MKRTFVSVLLAMVLSTSIMLAAIDPARAAWFFKPGYPDYAPSGMPDFDQKQDGWTAPGAGWTWCGPVSVANSLWWLDSEYESLRNPIPIPPPTISDNFPLVTAYGPWDDHDVRNVGLLVNNLAFLMDTDGRRTGLPHTGTNYIDMETGISQYLQQQGINPKGDCDGDGDVDYNDAVIAAAAYGSTPGSPNWNMAADLNQDNRVNLADLLLIGKNYGKVGMFYEKTMEFPIFGWIEREIKKCQDVVLQLTFWMENPPGSGNWVPVELPYDLPGGAGGHYVTCAGVDSEALQLMISDPWWDAAEAGFPGQVPVPHPPAHPASFHNDTLFVSHDIYGGLQWAPTPPGPPSPYPWTQVLELVGYLQQLGYPPNYHAFIRSAIETSPLQIATYNLHTMKKGCSPRATACKTMPMEVYVSVKNLDSVPLTFNVTTFANTTLIGRQQVTLNPSQNTNLTFTWSTVGLTEYTNYTFSATIESIFNVGGNTYSGETVMVTHMGDITGDGLVDIQDLSRVSGAFASIRINDPNNPKYGQYWHPIPCPYCPHQPNTDVNGDKLVDTQDLSRTSGNFGWHR
jgi:hypothetical protein